MKGTLLLVAVRTDNERLLLPARGVLEALCADHPGKVVIRKPEELTANDWSALERLGFDPDRLGLHVTAEAA